jgi:hypothetical protein
MKTIRTLIMAAFAAISCHTTPMATAGDKDTIFDSKAALEKPFAVNGGIMVISRYVGFANGAVFYNRPVTYGYLNMTHKQSGFSLGVWASTGFNGSYSNNWDDEIDISLGWSHQFEYGTLSLSQAYFDCFQVGTENANDVYYTNLQFSLPAKQVTSWLTVTPYVQYEIYVTQSDSPTNGGNVLSVGLNSEIKFTDRLGLSSNTSIKHDDGGFGLNPGMLVKNVSTLQYRVNEHLTANIIEATIWCPLMHDSRNTENTIGTGLSFSF